MASAFLGKKAAQPASVVTTKTLENMGSPPVGLPSQGPPEGSDASGVSFATNRPRT